MSFELGAALHHAPRRLMLPARSEGEGTTMKRNTRLHNAVLRGLTAAALALATVGCSHSAGPQDATTKEAGRKQVEVKKPDYSPYPDQHLPARVFWGVAHVHTGYSFDSGMFG